jgi:transcriptional regulator with XRE-family HTH domain
MPKNNKKVLGATIRELRRRLGYSQEELAGKAGLHRTYIGSVERGERNVSLENMVRIARAVGVTPSELLEGVE